MTDPDFDAIVIGGGSAGLSFARTAAAHGARVAVAERDRLGGTCVNRGCVPKKLMWELSHSAMQMHALEARGILNGVGSLDVAAFRNVSDRHVDGIVGNFRDALEDAGIVRLAAAARITAPGEVTVGDITAKAPRIVLATGGRPARPDMPGAELCTVSDDVFGWTRLPASLIIVGAGYIGCEMAAILAGLGVEVTLISDDETVLTEFSAPMQSLARDNLGAQGVQIVTNTRPDKVTKAGGGFHVHTGSGTPLEAEQVLLATGRAPNLDALGALADRIETNDAGNIEIDAGFATSAGGVFAIGDCTTRLPLTPVATDDGRVLALQQFGAGADPVDLQRVSTAAFLMPPVAEVGDTSGDLQTDRFDPISEGLFDAGLQGAWLAGTGDAGQMRAIGLAGIGAAEAVAFMGLSLAAGAARSGFSRALAVHPTSSEEIFSGMRDG